MHKVLDINVGNYLFKNKHVLVLIGILLLALVIRLFRLGSFPTNFHEDEVLVGYVGRFILQNGLDLYGNHWPLWFFDKFGDYYIIGPFYLSGLSTLIFGINEFAVRFPTAFLGALGTLPMYGFVYELFKSKKVALLSSFFLALLPWHIVLSRSSSEGVMGATFCLTALYLVLRGINKNAYKYIVFGLFSYLLSYWIYHPYRLYAPAFVILTLFFFWNYIKSRKIRITLLIGIVVFSIFTLWILSTPWGRGRLQQTSIFGGASGVSIRNQILIYDSGNNNPLLARLLHNKPLGYGREFLRQYFSYLSPKYLYIDSWGEKFVVPEQGMLYLSYLIYICIFIGYLGYELNKHQSRRPLTYYLVLVAVSLVPPAMTYIGSPNVNRSMMFGVFLIPAIAYGATKLLNNHKIIFSFISLLLLSEFMYFGMSYLLHFNTANSVTRQDAVKPLIAYVQQYQNRTVYIPQDSTMAIYYLFFTRNFDPSLAKQFKFEARIPQINNIRFIPESNCLLSKEESDEIGIKQGDIVALKYTCGEKPNTDKRFSLITFIKQTGELLGYRIYEYHGDSLDEVR